MTPIQEAKQRLPLPELMKLLGYGEYTKASVRSPFRKDESPSWGIFRKTNGEWNWKDHGNGDYGDEVDFIVKMDGCETGEALRKYIALAQIEATDERTDSKPAVKTLLQSDDQSNSPFNLTPLTTSQIAQIAEWRSYSLGFVSSLNDAGLIGWHDGCVAFPVHRAGSVIGCHYRKEDGSWRYTRGVTVEPLIIGNPLTADTVLLFESQWDALSVADKLDYFGSEFSRISFVITRGAANGKLVASIAEVSGRLIAVPQNDPPKVSGKIPSEEWMKAIQEAAGTTLHKLSVPNEFKDANDWLRTPVDIGTLKAALANAPRIVDSLPIVDLKANDIQAKKQVETINGKPALELPCDGRAIGEFAKDIGFMLQGKTIFARQGCAFIFNAVAEKLEPATSQWLRTWAEQHVSCYVVRRTQAGALRLVRTMSDDTARAVLVSPQFLEQLRKVEFFNPCRVPVLRENGNIELLSSGYDAESFTYTSELAPEIIPMDTPTALAMIEELLGEFPFAADSGRSKAVAISAMLTVFGSRILPKGALRPCFIYMGNAEGCGKTLLARLACAPYAAADVRGAPTTEEEFEKVFLSVVMGGRKVLLLDNLKGHLDSAKLEGFLTSTRYGGRILGLSKDFSGQVDITVLLTGNRLTVSSDLRRRTLVVELFMAELRAENRQFMKVLDDTAINQLRPKILSALWQFIRTWDEAGRPGVSRNNTSFPRWCETFGGIVEHAGFGCPTVPAEIEGMGDTNAADIAKLGEVMELKREYSFANIIALSNAGGLFERFTSDTELDGSLTRRATSSFSKLLLTYKGRQITPSRRFFIEGHSHKRKFLVT